MPLTSDITKKTLATPHGEAAYHIIDTLCDAGYDALWVGGAIRDMAIGKIPNDIDIATSAQPDEVLQLFPKADDAGKAYGSVVVRKVDQEIEITTFRQDDEASDGRHPESVVFGSQQDDAARRDFTINAMYWNPISNKLIDSYDGEKDLSERLVRFIGEPGMRIQHDVLRMLRAVRLRAAIDGQYHPETYKALQENATSISTLSGTRILSEIQKILMNPRPERAFEDLWELRILHEILPELAECKGIPQPADYHREGDVWDHHLQCIANARDEDGIDVRLAALFHDCGKVTTFSHDTRIAFNEHASASGDLAKEALGRLQCSKKRIDKIVWLVKHHMMMGDFETMNDTRLAHWFFHPWFQELLQLFWLDIAGTEPANFSLYEQIVEQYQQFVDSNPRPPKPLLSGEEIMEILDIEPGEKVGEVLEQLHTAQVEKRVQSKEEAKEFIKKHP